MIAYVKGELAFVNDNSIVVDANGIGYLINVSTATLSRLPQRGSQLQVFTYLQVAENMQSLHGFLTQEEVKMFTLLISVSGIGAKVGAAILGTLSPAEIMLAIVAEDDAALSKAPGVGKKTAQRLMLELRDKIKTGDVWDAPETTKSSGVLAKSGSKQDATDALLALGYGRAEALQAVMEVAEDDMTPDNIIRQALKKLAR